MARLNGVTVDLTDTGGAGTIGGSITDNQIAVGAATANSIEGNANLTWDGTTLDTGSTNIDAGEGRLDVKTIYVTGSTGGIVRIYGSGGTAYFSMLHDNTDINLAGLGGTVDMNITGLTAINAGTVDADFDVLTATSFNGVVLTTGGVATNYLDETGSYSVPPGSGGITQLTGDVTAGPGTGSQAATIANSAVTNAKMADMAANTVKYRGGTLGAPQDLAIPTNTVFGRQGAAPLCAQVVTAQIQDDNVTYAKMQNVVSANRLLGSLSAGGIVTELTGTQVNTFLPNFTSTLDGLAPLSGGGTTNYLRADGTWAAPPGAGSSTLAALTDTNITSPANGNILMWDSTPGEWIDATTLPAAYTFSNRVLFTGSVTGQSMSVSDDINLVDGAAVSLGTGSGGTGDIKILFDGTEIDITALSAQRRWNWFDGPEIRWWDSTDTDWIQFRVTTTNLDITESGLDRVNWPAAGTLDLSMNDNTIDQPILQDYAIESQAINVTGTTVTFAYSNGPVFECDMEAATGNVTATLSGGPPTGTYGQITVKMTQDTTVRTLSWAGGTFRWAGGTAHPVTTTANGFTIYTFETWDGGTTWYGAGADYS